MTRKNLKAQFFKLDSEGRRSVHFILCDHALKVRYLFVSTFDDLVYIESIVGTRQVFDKQLPYHALEAARQGKKNDDIARRYLEPVAAMQDGDLDFPENIAFSYYTIYNLFQKYAQDQPIDDWLIVNQALAANKNESSFSRLLTDAIKSTKTSKG
jgi:hypothetical protein